MLIPHDQFREQFERIREDAKSAWGGCSVLLLVAPEVDALCAARIIVKLLEIDDMEFKMAPVAGYTDMKIEIERASKDTRSIILVECGAPADMKRLLAWDHLSPKIKLYIIDSHRPVYHGNIHDLGRIFVFEESIAEGYADLVPNDGDSEIDETESVEDALEREEDGEGEGPVPDEESAEVEGDGEQLDGEAGSDEEGSGRKRKSTSAGSVVSGAGSSPGDGRRRKRLRPMRDQDGESSRSGSGSDWESEEEESGGGRRAQRQSDLALMLQRQHLKARCEGVRRVRNYYSGNLWSVPAAFLAWRLCEELGRERKDMLWLACVGCTDLLLTERITAATYEMCAAVLRTRVRTLGGDTPKPLREDGKVATAGMYAHVAPSVEPRWVLHRSWSVRDAMTHSDYVSTRLGMHKEAAETGPAKVDRLLSQTGVPHRLLQGPFDLFPRAARERLFRRLHELVQEDEYGLGPEMFFPSFVRIVDKEVEVSAGDVAAVVAGLLSASGTTPALVALAEGRKSSNLLEAAGGPRGASPAPLSQREDAHEYVTSWRYNFNLAYDGLAQRAPESFAAGLSVHKGLQAAILRLAPRMVRTGRVQSKKTVRWIELDEDVGEADRALFVQPLALAALGRYVIRMCRDSLMHWRRGRKGRVDTRPAIVTVHHPSPKPTKQQLEEERKKQAEGVMARRKTGWVTVLGLPVAAREGLAPAGDFLTLFQDAAARSGAAYMADGFDSSSLIMDVASLPGFMHQLDVLGEEED